MYNGRLRKLYNGTRGGNYVLSSGRKVYLKVKGSKKKAVKKKPVKKAVKKKVVKKKPVKKKVVKKKSASGLRMPRMSNLKRFKLFGGARPPFPATWGKTMKDLKNALKNNTLTDREICDYLKTVANSDDGRIFKVATASGKAYPLKHLKEGKYRDFLDDMNTGHAGKRYYVLTQYLNDKRFD